MLAPPLPLQLRPMRLADISAVMAVGRLSLPTPASERAWRHELVNNERARYQVLTTAADSTPSQIIGYAGYWLLGDEAHVIILAVHPDWRGRHLGELLLLNLLMLAQSQGAAQATLEVRRSNRVAQSLYGKYGFVIVGERPGYYRDSGEDAVLMTADLKDKGGLQDLAARWTALRLSLSTAY